METETTEPAEAGTPLIHDARAALERYFGFRAFLDGQETVIANILKGQDSKLLDAVRAFYNEGMMDFNKNLEDLCLRGDIDKATALEFSPNAEQLRMALKGIKVAASGLV